MSLQAEFVNRTNLSVNAMQQLSSQLHNMTMNGNTDHANNVNGRNISDSDLNPDSNVYVANLPSNYGHKGLHDLFCQHGEIMRHKFVQPEDPKQPGYGFVQFAKVENARNAIKKMEGHVFKTGEKIYLSIALRRRSSLSDEPTNLYVKNLPARWSLEKIKQVFSEFGSIRQSKVMGDGIAFVRYETHYQALNSIDSMNKKEIEGKQIDVRFATRKTAANAYRVGAVPVQKANEHNLYVRNLPKTFGQQELEKLFTMYGKISSGKVNENGVAFVRYAHADDAQKAIKQLNGTKPKGYGFEEEIIVKLAHFDIGDSRNRDYRFKEGNNANNSGNSYNNNNNNNNNNSNSSSGNTGNSSQAFTNVYRNHLQAPMQPRSGTQIYSNAQHNAQMQQQFNPNGYINPQQYSYNQAMDPNHATNNLLNPMVSQLQIPDMNGHGINGNGTPTGIVLNGTPTRVSGFQNNVTQQTQLNNNNLNWGVPLLPQQPNFGNLSPHSQTNPNGNVLLNNFNFPQQNLLTNLNNLNLLQTQIPTQVNSVPLLMHSNPIVNNSSSINNSLINNNNSNSNSNIKTWTGSQQEQGDKIYQLADQKYPGYAGKITGMLLKCGEEKTSQMLKDPHVLNKKITDAYHILLNNNDSLKSSGNTPPLQTGSNPNLANIKSSLSTGSISPHTNTQTNNTNSNQTQNGNNNNNNSNLIIPNLLTGPLNLQQLISQQQSLNSSLNNTLSMTPNSNSDLNNQTTNLLLPTQIANCSPLTQPNIMLTNNNNLSSTPPTFLVNNSPTTNNSLNTNVFQPTGWTLASMNGPLGINNQINNPQQTINLSNPNLLLNPYNNNNNNNSMTQN